MRLLKEPCDKCGQPLSGFWITKAGHICDTCHRQKES